MAHVAAKNVVNRAVPRGTTLPVKRLTRREQLVLAGLLALLLVGAAVKWYRTTRPPAATGASSHR